MTFPRLIIGLLLLPVSAMAEFAIGAKAGSIGAGLEAAYHFDDQFVVRLSFNSYTLSNDREVSDINYDYDLNLRSGALQLDIFPKGKRFYFTGGLLFNGNNFEATANVENSINVGGTTYTAAQVGNFSGELDFKPISPYLGLGWRWRHNEPGISLGVEAGLLFHGQGEVKIFADGPIADTAAFMLDVEQEIDEIEDKLGIAKLYPVLEARIAYRFK